MCPGGLFLESFKYEITRTLLVELACLVYVTIVQRTSQLTYSIEASIFFLSNFLVKRTQLRMRRERAKNHKAVQFRIVQTGLVPTGLAL